MKTKLLFASTITLGILFSFVFFIFLLIALWSDTINIWTAVGLTILINFILWGISPYITDFMLWWFYRIRTVKFEEFEKNHNEVAVFIEKVCKKNKIKIPRLKIINDENPTAYCYGSHPYNSRLVVSEGIFKYLNIEEQKAVFGHELGHIVNKDFIIMTIASTFLQILYEIYYTLSRNVSPNSGKIRKITDSIAVLSYIFYVTGTYLILYLSRTREYLADRFSAEHTNNPDALSMALVKIAYGIAVEAESGSTQRLLASTRAMGIYDFKVAHSVGMYLKFLIEDDKKEITRDFTKVFLFDLFSPWAVISEINSTHPLTGKRIKALSQYAKEIGNSTRFDFEKVIQEGKELDRNRLYNDFFKGIIFYFLPILAVFAVFVMIKLNPANYPMSLVIMGVSLFVRGLYMFERPGSVPEKTTVFELMQDPYANPIKGRFVEIEGKVIGKGDSGSREGEDIEMQDKSGCLIYLNYESWCPILGNMFFGMGEAEVLIRLQDSKAVGWFRRSSYSVIDLDIIESYGIKMKSYNRFWGIAIGIFLIFLGIILEVI